MIKNILLFAFGFMLLSGNSIFASEQQKQDSVKSDVHIKINDVEILSSFSRKKGYEAVSLSTLSSKDIQNKLGTQEFVEVMKSIPSVYATKKGGGYGDSRITLRGFSTANVPVLINGIPANGMENSGVYWSNWAGLSDVTGAIQVQRGIGLSKLGLFSAGGTINIITQLPSLTPKGQVFYKGGSDGYNGYGVAYSTGDLPKGWNVAFMGSRVSGDGYVNGTAFEAYTYHVNVTKYFKNSHKLSLVAFGSPQWHNSRSNKHSIEDYEKHKDGIRMNTSYGYINGEVVPTWGGYNEYHKPMVSLNHFWTINSKSYISNVVYMSNAKGGGKKLYGDDKDRLQYNYATGKPYDGKYGSTDLTPEGYIDYAPMMEKNRNSENGSSAIFANTINDHDWYGLLSSYGNQLSDEVKFTTGIDMRYYKGYHYDEVSDLLGGEYFKDSYLSLGDQEHEHKVGDKLMRNYYSEILWAGVFAQLEWKKDNFNSFLTVSTTSNSYKRTDEGKYYKEMATPEKEAAKDPLSTDWNNFLPYSVKLGSNFRFAEYHNVYINGGYSTRAPEFENIYPQTNTPIADPITEKVATIEAGYGVATSNFSLSLTAYYTKWLDKNLVQPIGGYSGPKAYIPNVDALHKGIEFDVTYQPVHSVLLKGFFTIADWRWTNDVSYTMVDENNEVEGEYNAYLEDLKVGNAPQMSAMLGVTFIPMEGVLLGVDFNYYGDHYAEFNPGTRTNADDRSQSWKLPDYHTFDFNATYNVKITKKLGVQVFGNVNNILNAEYITDATDGEDHNSETAVVWYGYGRTWVVGCKFNF